VWIELQFCEDMTRREIEEHLTLGGGVVKMLLAETVRELRSKLSLQS
jgi:hypothetical protein